MRRFINQTSIVLVLVLLRFGGSLTAKCASKNNQPCIVRPTLLNLDPDELCYDPCVISLDSCCGVVILLKIHLLECVYPIKQKV